MKIKSLLYLIVSILLIQCSSQSTTKATTKPAILEGPITKEKLIKNYDWFTSEYDSYKVDSNTIIKFDRVENWNPKTQIQIFMGTWCGDSQQQVPRMIKVLDSLDFKNYTIITLNNEKSSKKGYELGKNIIRVPTFIVYQNRAEINRIIETPVKTLESDLYQILNQNYTPHKF